MDTRKNFDVSSFNIDELAQAGRKFDLHVLAMTASREGDIALLRKISEHLEERISEVADMNEALRYGRADLVGIILEERKGEIDVEALNSYLNEMLKHGIGNDAESTEKSLNCIDQLIQSGASPDRAFKHVARQFSSSRLGWSDGMKRILAESYERYGEFLARHVRGVSQEVLNDADTLALIGKCVSPALIKQFIDGGASREMILAEVSVQKKSELASVEFRDNLDMNLSSKAATSNCVKRRKI